MHRLRRSILLAVTLSLPVLGCGAPQTPAAQRAPSLTSAQSIEIATLLEARGDAQRAGQYLTLALEQGADEREVVPRLLRLYVHDGQYRLAAERAENFLRRHPRDLTTRFLLASLYAGLGDAERAATHYRRVL